MCVSELSEIISSIRSISVPSGPEIFSKHLFISFSLSWLTIIFAGFASFDVLKFLFVPLDAFHFEEKLCDVPAHGIYLKAHFYVDDQAKERENRELKSYVENNDVIENGTFVEHNVVLNVHFMDNGCWFGLWAFFLTFLRGLWSFLGWSGILFDDLAVFINFLKRDDTIDLCQDKL